MINSYNIVQGYYYNDFSKISLLISRFKSLVSESAVNPFFLSCSTSKGILSAVIPYSLKRVFIPKLSKNSLVFLIAKSIFSSLTSHKLLLHKHTNHSYEDLNPFVIL